VKTRGAAKARAFINEREAAIDKEQILVIDDESSVADALRLILEDDGYKVTVALSGLEGIELVWRRCFDVVVSDVRLPDITGLEVLDAVRRGCPGSVVILITSQWTTKLREEARDGGAFDVLQKPFPPRDVLHSISAALRKIC
jgi:DNA-binding NtrC family response regulator